MGKSLLNEARVPLSSLGTPTNWPEPWVLHQPFLLSRPQRIPSSLLHVVDFEALQTGLRGSLRGLATVPKATYIGSTLPCSLSMIHYSTRAG